MSTDTILKNKKFEWAPPLVDPILYRGKEHEIQFDQRALYLQCGIEQENIDFIFTKYFLDDFITPSMGKVSDDGYRNEEWRQKVINKMEKYLNLPKFRNFLSILLAKSKDFNHIPGARIRVKINERLACELNLKDSLN